MPGIAGLISRRPPRECGRLLERMATAMQHEKFYVAEDFSAPELGVFVARVALESSSAEIPARLARDANVALLMTGECFSSQGQVTPGDAARLALLYERQGPAVFETLDGIFSGMLVDRERQRAILFNDRYGLERVYYHETRDALYFASEAKALLRILPELRAYDDEALADFLQYGCTLNWKSL